MSSRPFKKLFCDRKEVFLLPFPAFKVWMYHYCREGPSRTSWPSRDSICTDLGMSIDALKDARKYLLTNGWLEQVGEKKSKDGHRTPVFRVKRGTVVVKNPRGRRGLKPPRGDGAEGLKTPVAEGVKTTHEVYTIKPEVDSVKQEVEETMSAKKQIPVICLQVLGMKAERWDNIWAEIKELTDAFGQNEVTTAFRDWAVAQDPDSVKKPLAEFLDVAPGILRGIRTLHTDRECQVLITELGDLSDGVVLFNDKLSTEIARLRKNYPDADIKAAYHEFLANRGDFNLNYAAKDFTETAVQLIEIRRKRQEKIEQTNKQIETIVEKGQAESEKILSNIPKPVDFGKIL